MGRLPQKATLQNEDHNWRWRIPYKYCAKGAISATNRPHSRAGRTRNTYINKQSHLDEPVETQTPMQMDGHQIVNKMDNSIRKNFESLHLSTRDPIRDKEPLQQQITATPKQSVSVTERPLPHPTDTIPSEEDAIIQKITTAYEIARQAPKVPLPKHVSDAQELLEDTDEIPKPRMMA